MYYTIIVAAPPHPPSYYKILPDKITPSGTSNVHNMYIWVAGQLDNQNVSIPPTIPSSGKFIQKVSMGREYKR